LILNSVVIHPCHILFYAAPYYMIMTVLLHLCNILNGFAVYDTVERSSLNAFRRHLHALFTIPRQGFCKINVTGFKLPAKAYVY
jgi:hypothetical protein